MWTASVQNEKGVLVPPDTKTITKWSAKVTSAAIDCLDESDDDDDEFRLAGKLSITFDDGIRIDVSGDFNWRAGGLTDVLDFSGRITRGPGFGTTFTMPFAATPTVKDAAVTIDYQGSGQDYVGKSIARDMNVTYDYLPLGPQNDAIPPSNELAAFQGYRISGTEGLMVGCGATVEPVTESVNLRTFYLQGGSSPLYATPLEAAIAWTSRPTARDEHWEIRALPGILGVRPPASSAQH